MSSHDDIGGYRYNRNKVFGTGSFAKVYVGTNLQGRRAAIKEYNLTELHGRRDVTPEMLKAIRKEASLMCQLQHPNIVAVYHHDTLVVRGQRYARICQELCTKQVLQDYIDEVSAMGISPEQFDGIVLRFMEQIASALTYLQDRPQPIVHRDLHLGNVLIDGAQNFKIVDFGLAKLMNNGGAGGGGLSTKTKSLGNMYFRPPEIFEEAKGSSYGKECDIWSFGALLYWVATRETAVPLERTMTTSKAYRYLKTHEDDLPLFSNPRSLRYISPGLAPIVQKAVRSCLQVRPKRRIAIRKVAAAAKDCQSNRIVMTVLPQGQRQSVYLCSFDKHGSPEDIRDIKTLQSSIASSLGIPANDQIYIIESVRAHGSQVKVSDLIANDSDPDGIVDGRTWKKLQGSTIDLMRGTCRKLPNGIFVQTSVGEPMGLTLTLLDVATLRKDGGNILYAEHIVNRTVPPLEILTLMKFLISSLRDSLQALESFIDFDFKRLKSHPGLKDLPENLRKDISGLEILKTEGNAPNAMKDLTKMFTILETLQVSIEAKKRLISSELQKFLLQVRSEVLYPTRELVLLFAPFFAFAAKALTMSQQGWSQLSTPMSHHTSTSSIASEPSSLLDESQQIAKLLDKIDKLEQDKATLKSKLQTQTTDFEQERSQYLKAGEDRDTHAEAQAQEIQVLKREKEDLKLRLRNLAQPRADDTEKIKQLQDQNRDSERKQRELRRKIQTMEQEHKAALEDARKQIEELRGQTNEAYKKYDQACQRILEMSAQVTSQTEEKSEAESQHEETQRQLQYQIRQLEDELHAEKNAHEDMRERVIAQQKELDEARADTDLETLKSEIENLEGRIKKKDEEYQKAKADADELRKEIQQMRNIQRNENTEGNSIMQGENELTIKTGLFAVGDFAVAYREEASARSKWRILGSETLTLDPDTVHFEQMNDLTKFKSAYVIEITDFDRNGSANFEIMFPAVADVFDDF